VASTVPSQTVRYYATSQQGYARALLALTAYARISEGSFSFGPLDLAVLEHQGLSVTFSGPGSGADLAKVRETLSTIAGLVQEEQ
jgi:hypothetical protein